MKRLKYILLILLISAGIFAVMYTPEPTQSSAELYRTAKVTRGNIAEGISATGNIVPEEVVTVGTQVSGQIMKMHAKLNDTVTKGQLLAEIDPSIPETQLRQSKAALDTAQLAYELSQRDYERSKALVAKDYIAKIELERAWQNVVNARTSLASAKIQVERDEVNLSYTKVTSPIDGIIIAQEVASGQTLAANFQTPDLFRIAKDLTMMKIDMSIPEADISKIHVDMPVAFTVGAYPERVFEGVISAINLSPNNQAGVVTYNVVVKVENHDRALLPGMTASIVITLSEVKDVLRVPASALRFSPPQKKISMIKLILGGSTGTSEEEDTSTQTIYLVKGNRIERVPVTVGANDDLYVEIISDKVKEGDIVVTGLQVQDE